MITNSYSSGTEFVRKKNMTYKQQLSKHAQKRSQFMYLFLKLFGMGDAGWYKAMIHYVEPSVNIYRL